MPTTVAAAIGLAGPHITVGEAREIVEAAETTRAGAPSPVTPQEAKEIAALLRADGFQVTPPAKNVLEAFFFRHDLPYGVHGQQLRGKMEAAAPKILPAPLGRAPTLSKLYEVALTSPPLIGGPERRGFYEPHKPRFFVRETVAGKARWYGPFDLAPKLDPDQALIRSPPAMIQVTMTIDGNRHPQPAFGGHVWLGGLPAASSVAIALPGGKQVTVKGPLGPREKLVAGIDRALPAGFYVQGRYIGGHYWEDTMRDNGPVREGTYTLRFFKGQPPGGLSLFDLPKLRAMKHNLQAFLAKPPAHAQVLPAERLPRLDAAAGLYRLATSAAGRPTGNALITVFQGPKPAAGKAREVVFFDPRQSAIYFGKIGGAGAAIRGPVRGPTQLDLQPAGRFFSFAEVKAMQEVVNR
jgi:hypothetical protein